MATQPRGIVTLLFSDIEGSTSLLEELGAERYEGALDRQRLVIREAVASHEGYEVSCEADSFFVAFGSAGAAVEAAVDAQRKLAATDWPDGRPVRVRMGIHTGEPRIADGNYVGIDVHQAARIMAAAHGGQVLLSEATSGRIEGRDVRDLGVHQLRDLSVPQRLFQLEDQQLPQRFPPPRTAESGPTKLPGSVNPLLGRTEELAELKQLLGKPARLVTLVGTGGAGKTRLALELARRIAGEYTDGVYFVELAATLDGAAVASEIAAAIGLLDTSFESLERYLHSKRVLVVADNLEQIPDAGGALAKLLAVSLALTIVATSRTPLRVTAERVYAVPELDENAAVELFAARAAAAEPSFQLTAENEESVRAICRRLEGLPLAIELAATRISVLTPSELLGRLDSRLELLTSGGTDAPSRHRTLRSTIAWSYELLTPTQQELFARLGAFSDGFKLDAAEKVADASLDDLAALVDGNLIRRRDGRFTMLETLREYALDQLTTLGLDDDARDRHATYYETLMAEQAESDINGAFSSIEGDSLGREKLYLRETGNVRTALDRLSAHTADLKRALTFASNLPWAVNVVEGQTRLQALLPLYTVPDLVRARGLNVLCDVAAARRQIDLVREAAAEAMAIYTSIGGREGLAGTFAIWDAVRNGCMMVGDIAGYREAIERAAEVADKLDDSEHTIAVEVMFLHLYAWSRDFDAFEVATQRFRELDMTRYPDFPALVGYFEGEVALGRGDPAAAKGGFQARLAECAAADANQPTAIALEGVAMSLAGTSNPRLGLKLGAAVHTLWMRWGFDPEAYGTWNELRQRYFGAARVALGVEADDVWAEGLRTPTAEAVALALGA